MYNLNIFSVITVINIARLLCIQGQYSQTVPDWCQMSKCMHVYDNKCTYTFVIEKEIPSKHKSSLISLFKIHISFSAGVKEKNFWFLGLLPLNAIFIVMFWTNKPKLLFIINPLRI